MPTNPLSGRDLYPSTNHPTTHLPTIAPIKRPSVNNHPSNGGPVPTNPLGRALHDDIGPVLGG